LFSTKVDAGSVFHRNTPSLSLEDKIKCCVDQLNSPPKADIQTFRAIVPRTLHTIDSSSYGSVCQEQLIYSQWACGRKGLAGEGLTEILFDKNLL
jgi:hypothetical protein